MKSTLTAACTLIGLAGLFWLVLASLFYLGPAYDFKFYPSTTVPLFTVGPLFVSSYAASRITGKPSPVDWWVFRGIIIIAFGAMAYLTEAAIIHAALRQAQQISYAEILLSPISQRYSITVLFGLSFLTSGLLVAAMIAFVSVPARVSIRLQRDAAQTSETSGLR